MKLNNKESQFWILRHFYFQSPTKKKLNKKTNMIVFKNLNDNKTYIIYKAPNGNCLAVPFRHDGPSIPKCDMNDFVVVSSEEGRLDGFL